MDHPRLEEKLIFKALRDLGIETKVVNVLSSPLKLEHVEDGLSIIRTVSMYRGVRSAAFLEAAGHRTINSSKALMICGDKALTYAALKMKEIPIPTTLLALSEESAVKAYRSLGGKVVDKPPVGSWGRLVSLIKNELSMLNLVRIREGLPSNVRGHIIQKYVETGGKDLRCLVLGSGLLGCVERRAKNGWRSNVALGATTREVVVTEEMEELSLKAAESVGGEFVAVDLLSDGQIYVNEVNGIPEFKGFMKATGTKVHRLLAQQVRKVIRT